MPDKPEFVAAVEAFKLALQEAVNRELAGLQLRTGVTPSSINIRLMIFRYESSAIQHRAVDSVEVRFDL